MKDISLKICLLIVSLFGVVGFGVASNLPNCQKDGVATGHNPCFDSLKFSSGDKYVGDFKDGKIHGQGTFTWINGAKYTGEWKYGKRTQGTIIRLDGATYVGEWRDQLPNGKGAYEWVDGTKYIGQFKDGKRNGEGTYTDIDGKVEFGIWKNDEFQYAKTPSKPVNVAKIDRKDYEVLSTSSSYGADKIFMICKTEAMGERRVANGYAFHAEIDIVQKRLNWNGWKSNELKIEELRFFAIMECITPINGGCILPFVAIDRLTGGFRYQTWGDDGEFNGTCRVSDKKKKLF